MYNNILFCDIFYGCFLKQQCLHSIFSQLENGMQHSGNYFPRFSCSAAMDWDSESVKSADVFKQPDNPEGEMKMQPSTPQNQGGVRLHEFVSKTVRMPFL